MNLLNRYILSRYLRIFALALAAFSGLYLLVHFFEKVDNLIGHQASLPIYFIYFASKVPLIIVQVAPLGILLSSFLTIGGLARTSELTALWAGGVSLTRIALPLLGAAGVLSLLLLLINETLVPASTRTANRVWETDVYGRPAVVFKRDSLWIREGGKVIHVRLAHPDEDLLEGLQIFRFDENFRLLERIEAERARYREGAWVAEEGTRRLFSPGGDMLASHPFDQTSLPLEKPPEEFKIAERDSEEFNFRELGEMASRLQAEGYDPSRYLVDMHARLALPFAGLIMGFLGIPFALQKGRGGNIALGVALTVAVGFSYHILHAVVLAMGKAGLLPPRLAAWIPNLLFLLIGVWLLLMARR